MERALYSWTTENREKLKVSSLEVALVDDKGVEFIDQNGHRFQLSVPSAIFTTHYDEDDEDLDFFLAYCIGKHDESRKEFQDKVKSLNDKIQNVEISLGHKALEVVMDRIVAIFADVQALEDLNLDKKVEELVQKSGASSASRGMLKAVMVEFKKLSRCSLPGISVEIPDESDVCKWHVKMDKDLFKESKDLYEDLQNYASRVRVRANENGEGYFGGILLEVLFPKDYTFSPPFVRVLSPKFRFRSGHVTLGGAICTEMLTPSGWSPSLSMETVVVVIQQAILEGEGRLELEASASDVHRDYSLEEARAAFNRFAREHGWLN